MPSLPTRTRAVTFDEFAAVEFSQGMAGKFTPALLSSGNR